MSMRDRIKKEIEIQKIIEPDKCQEEILLAFLDSVRTDGQWNSMINCKHYPYGKLSYETHRFYYPTQELINFINLIKQKEN